MVDCVWGEIKPGRRTRKDLKLFNFKVFISKRSIRNVSFLLGVKDAYLIMCSPWRGESGSCLKAALLFLDCSSLVSLSPSFPDQQLSEPASWNSGEVMESEWGPFPKNKKWETQEGSCAQEPHKTLLSYTNSTLCIIAQVFPWHVTVWREDKGDRLAENMREFFFFLVWFWIKKK